MSQFDFGTIDPYVVDGVQLADMLNQWRDAIYSMHRGATRPAYVVPGMMWIDDSAGPTNWVVNVHFGPTVGDKPLFNYNTTTGAITMSAAAGGTFSAATLLAQSAANPSVRWNATGNPVDQKDWRSWITNTGGLHFGFFNDAGVEQAAAAVQFNPDGSNSLIPPGVMWEFAGAAAPTGWYFCDGVPKSRTTDAKLFAAIGTVFGAGDGSTTFGIPDTRGRVTAGPDPTNLRLGGSTRPGTFSAAGSAVLGAAAGEQTHTLIAAEQANTGANWYNPQSLGPATNYANGPNPLWYADMPFGNVAHGNTQPTLIVNKIIKR